MENVEKQIVKIIENNSPELAAEEILRLLGVVGRSEQLSCGRNITTCVFYKDGGKCSNLEYCRDQTT